MLVDKTLSEVKVKSIPKFDKGNIDNVVFRLHYKVTMIILIGFSIVVVGNQFIRNPIHCSFMAGFKDKKQPKIDFKIVEQYCWFRSTYTVPDIGNNTVYPGVGGHSSEDKLHYHSYYQWVSFAMFIQSLMFCVPRVIWRLWEDGRVKALLMDFTYPKLFNLGQKEKSNQFNQVLSFFVMNLGEQNDYPLRFFFCEILNFVNVVGQMYLTDLFLGHQFMNLGLAALSKSPQDIDPMAKIFPKMTKCTFKTYGPAGGVVPHDSICVIPMNIVNEKMYLFLWFWYIILAMISGLVLIFRLVIIFGPMIGLPIRTFMLRANLPFCNKKKIAMLCKVLPIGDWFVLYQLGKSMDPVIYEDIVEELAEIILDDGEKRELNSP